MRGKARTWLCGRTVRRQRACPANGFTLLEVMVATALMGLVLVVVMQLMAAGLDALKVARQQTAALAVAERIMDDYCQNRALRPGTFSGQEGKYAYQVYLAPQYTVTLPEVMARGKLTCYLVRVSVAWKEGGKSRSVELETARTLSQEKS